MGCGVDDPETPACEIADELAFDPSRIKAVVLEKVEAINENIFDDDAFRFDDDENGAEIFNNLEDQQKEKERFEIESHPVYIEIHDGDTVTSFSFEELRETIKGFITSRKEQDSFIKMAEEIFRDAGYLPPNQ